MNIKTLQWNIGGGRVCKEGADYTLPPAYTENGLDSIIEFLKREQPDILTLQETHESKGGCQTQIIAEALNLSYWTNDSYDESFIEKGQRIGQAVISKYPIVEKRFALFTNPEFSFIDDDGNKITSKNGGLTECVIELPDKNLLQIETFHMMPFHFFAVDLDSEQALKVLREVQSLIGKAQIPTIVQADFNLNCPGIRQFFAETFAAGMREVIQQNPTTPKGKRLDHILYAGIKHLKSEVVKDVRTDHYPIISMFQIEDFEDKETQPAHFIRAESEYDPKATIGQPPIDDTVISAESLGIDTINEDTWKFFDKKAFGESPNAKLVLVSKLIQAKVHAPDPDVLNGNKPHPVFKAYSYFLILSGRYKNPLVMPRKPITVAANPDGTYNIVDGSATVQAAIFVGWKYVPVIVMDKVL